MIAEARSARIATAAPAAPSGTPSKRQRAGDLPEGEGGAAARNAGAGVNGTTSGPPANASGPAGGGGGAGIGGAPSGGSGGGGSGGGVKAPVVFDVHPRRPHLRGILRPGEDPVPFNADPELAAMLVPGVTVRGLPG